VPMTDTRFVEVKRGCTGAPPILPEWLLPPIALWLGEAGEVLATEIPLPCCWSGGGAWMVLLRRAGVFAPVDARDPEIGVGVG
jgi:hypothetical protein